MHVIEIRGSTRMFESYIILPTTWVCSLRFFGFDDCMVLVAAMRLPDLKRRLGVVDVLERQQPLVDGLCSADVTLLVLVAVIALLPLRCAKSSETSTFDLYSTFNMNMVF